MLRKLKELVRKDKHSPCFFIYKTKKNINVFFMKDNMTSFEKKVNKLSLKRTDIKTVEQGKRLFFRFLKNNDCYEEYMKIIKYLITYKNIYSKNNVTLIDYIIKHHFLTPFELLLDEMKGSHIQDIRKKFTSLELKWQRFLRSIGYI